MGMLVVYFDQRTGALPAVSWSKSIAFTLKQIFLMSQLAFGFQADTVNQHLGVTVHAL